MSKFCTQCGKEISNNDVHCQFCGAEQNDTFEDLSIQSGDSKAASKKSGLLVPLVAIAALILVIVIVVLNLTIFRDTYETPVENWIKAYQTGDYDYIEDTLPDCILDSDSYDDEKWENRFERKNEELDILEYKIIDTEKMESKELKRMAKLLKDEYGEKPDVEEGYIVEVKATVERDGEETTERLFFNVYKIDGDWCLAGKMSDIYDIKSISTT